MCFGEISLQKLLDTSPSTHCYKTQPFSYSNTNSHGIHTTTYHLQRHTTILLPPVHSGRAPKTWSSSVPSQPCWLGLVPIPRGRTPNLLCPQDTSTQSHEYFHATRLLSSPLLYLTTQTVLHSLAATLCHIGASTTLQDSGATVNHEQYLLHALHLHLALTKCPTRLGCATLRPSPGPSWGCSSNKPPQPAPFDVVYPTKETGKWRQFEYSRTQRIPLAPRPSI